MKGCVEMATERNPCSHVEGDPPVSVNRSIDGPFTFFCRKYLTGFSPSPAGSSEQPSAGPSGGLSRSLMAVRPRKVKKHRADRERPPESRTSG